MSSNIILMISVIPGKISTDLFTNEIYSIAAKSKANLLKSFEHHGTKGYNYSFGNKLLYGNSNGSSVSTYTIIKHKNKVIVMYKLHGYVCGKVNLQRKQYNLCYQN